jgi:hypothetical protein
MKRYQVIILAANTFLSIALVVLVATLILIENSQGPESMESNLAAELKELKTRVDEISVNQQELMKASQDISEAMQKLLRSASEKDFRSSLPEKYLDQIDSFFASKDAQDLLSEMARKRGVWTFNKPAFLAHDLLSVEYSFAGETETLMVSVKVLDYTDLEFKVIWDSFEIQP